MKNTHNKNIILLTLLYIVGSISFFACKAPEAVTDKRIDLPQAAMQNDSLQPLPWSEFFQDERLAEYIQAALTNNHSFQQALERVNISRANLRRAKGTMLPSVAAGLGISSTRFGEYTMDGVGNSTTNTPDLSAEKHIPDPYSDFGLNVGFQWEVDVWGKLTNKKRAALSRWMASEEALRFSQAVLISELAAHYFELIGLDKRNEVLQVALQKAQRSYNLTKELKQEGVETQLAVDQFYARTLLLESQLLANKQLIGEQERAISCLIGVFPFYIKRTDFDDLRKQPFPLSKGVPSNLLTLRPDVREAELELIACNADTKAARAAFYPSLVLGGSGGFNSFDIAKWFAAPASLVYNLAAGITAPIFKQHEIRSLWNTAQAEQRIALSHYHETAIKAYTEVADLLTAVDTQQKQLELKQKEVEVLLRSSSDAYELFQVSYIGFLEVLSAEERSFTGEMEYIQLNTQYCMQRTLLYRALGGGMSSVR